VQPTVAQAFRMPKMLRNPVSISTRGAPLAGSASRTSSREISRSDGQRRAQARMAGNA
jgi:hypothetical protein